MNAHQVIVTRDATVAGTLHDLERRGLVEWFMRLCDARGMHFERVLSREQDPPAARARYEVWAVLHWSLAIGLSELGRIFRRDHATILHGIRTHQKRIEEAAQAAA